MSLPNTHYGAKEIASILDGKKNLFFAGIGGISMNSLAHISHLRGFHVSGYDRTPSALTESLAAMGITVYYEADARHVSNCDALVYTVAMPADNPEYTEALSRGIPVISRADYLGYIMTGYKSRIGVSGTHGKSTTTGMITNILIAAGVDPTLSGGAAMKETGAVDRIGGHDYFVFEACEYMDSFLDFNPSTAVVLNIEMDHVDYFHSIEQMRASYTQFMSITGKNGFAVINADDENCRLAAAAYAGQVVTFGRNDPACDCTSVNEKTEGGYPAFDILWHGVPAGHVVLQIPGEQNIADALASFAACAVNGIPTDVIAAGLSSYQGICRRMERIALSPAGYTLYADYAHHPTEIRAALGGARAICRGKLRVVFQSHTYSRTAELFDDFIAAFADSGADEVVFCPIYPARETNIYGVSAEQMRDALLTAGKTARFAPTFEDAADSLASTAQDGDMILVMGAGDVIRVADLIEARIAAESVPQN